MQKLERRIAVARGDLPADLVLKNAGVVNVFTGEVLTADVAVVDGTIAGVGGYEGKTQRDCSGLYLCPGFIDAHMHIESSMALPGELVHAVLPSGTTTLVADPHEIVNVAGAEGLRFMLQASEGLPCNIYYMLPSSVPSTPFETAGANFTSGDMREFLHHPNVLGLGEVMCYNDVVAAAPHVLQKLAATAGRPVDGHAPGLTGKALQAYAAAGVGTEHECTTFAEAAEKARAGLAILVREGSAAHNLTALITGLLESGMPTNLFLFCTDDKHLADIRRDGHIRWNVKMAIDLGMDPVQAICMATWNTARHYNLQGLGAVAAGYRADLVLMDSLKEINVVEVYKDGVTAEECIANLPEAPKGSRRICQSVNAPRVAVEDLAIPAGEATAIGMVPYQLVTKRLAASLPGDGTGRFAPNKEFCELCVVERHGKTGAIRTAALKGYGIQGGAIATTVAHDSHNILAAGDNDGDIALAINRLGEIHGGYVLVQSGKVVGEVPLPVAGLMSDAPWQQVEASIAAISKRAHAMGIPYYFDPFISLSFLALPVIPEIRLTDKGMVDVMEGRLL